MANSTSSSNANVITVTTEPSTTAPQQQDGQSTAAQAEEQPEQPPGRHLKTKSVCNAYLLALPFGWTGAHHFYLRRQGYGVIYLFTFGLLGCGWIVDLFRLPCLVRDANSKSNLIPHAPKKTISDTYVLWFPLGLFGAHHYYLKRWTWGVLYTCTVGLLGIGWIIDICRIPFLVMAYNAKQKIRWKLPGYRPKKIRKAYALGGSPLGLLGCHHYYLQRYYFGLLYTCTCGLLMVGCICDLCRMPRLVRRANKLLRSGIKKQWYKYTDDAYILLCPCGFTGLHHYYLRRYAWGILYTFTLGICFLGWIADIFRLPKLVRHYNNRLKTRFADVQVQMQQPEHPEEPGSEPRIVIYQPTGNSSLPPGAPQQSTVYTIAISEGAQGGVPSGVPSGVPFTLVPAASMVASPAAAEYPPTGQVFPVEPPPAYDSLETVTDDSPPIAAHSSTTPTEGVDNVAFDNTDDPSIDNATNEQQEASVKQQQHGKMAATQHYANVTENGATKSSAGASGSYSAGATNVDNAGATGYSASAEDKEHLYEDMQAESLPSKTDISISHSLEYSLDGNAASGQTQYHTQREQDKYEEAMAKPKDEETSGASRM